MREIMLSPCYEINKQETPVMLLGLKRDMRKGLPPRLQEAKPNDHTPRLHIEPQEALQLAQSLRLDKYMECSAFTGELCREVFEDISKTAAKTQTGLSEMLGEQCMIL
jgi:Ras homolog gene family, member A